MKLEKQVTSLKLSKKLKKLGVLDMSVHAWVKHPSTKDYYLMRADKAMGRANLLAGNYGVYSAFTVAELGEMLPETNWQTYREKKGWILTDHQINIPIQKANTEASARAKMLIYLIENDLLKQGRLGK